MSRTLVIRFGALGDLCLLSWSLARYSRQQTANGATGLTLVTKAAYASLLGRAAGVEEVVALEGPRLRDLVRLAGLLHRNHWDRIIDAHGNLRSHLLLAMLGRRPQRRLAKDTASRLALLLLQLRPSKLARSMRDRFDDLFAPDNTEPDLSAAESSLAMLDVPPPLTVLRPAPLAGLAPLGLAPGARWPSKRWPAEHFAAFLRGFRASCSNPVRVFLGPDEESWFDASELSRAISELPDMTVWRQLDLVRVARRLGECGVLVTNDSGLLHVAEAVGTPVLALFGPTVQEFGYFPGLQGSRVLQSDLPCRPCSRNGKRPCWRGDLACLTEMSPDHVLQTLLAMPAWSRPVPPGSDHA